MTFKRKLCKHCKGKLEAGQYIHPECIDPFSESEAAKAERRQAKRVKDAVKAERAQDRSKAEGMKSQGTLMAEADRAFAEFIRERDRAAGWPCVSSGKPLKWDCNQTDAGHFRSRGAASHLRYNEDNCHAQSKHDNRWLSGNAVEYRARLIERIGLERLEAVEQDNRIHKWTHEELREIRDKYRKKAADLKKARLARC